MPNPHGSASALSWRIKDEPGATLVEFAGAIDENADFAALIGRLKGKVVFHLAGVKRINSFGAREWVRFLRELRQVNDLTFTHCSPVFVMQLNMIHAFRGQAHVASFLAPYVCAKCEKEEERLIHTASAFPGKDYTQLPNFPCSCGGTQSLDDVAERYLDFMKDR